MSRLLLGFNQLDPCFRDDLAGPLLYVLEPRVVKLPNLLLVSNLDPSLGQNHLDGGSFRIQGRVSSPGQWPSLSLSGPECWVIVVIEHVVSLSAVVLPASSVCRAHRVPPDVTRVTQVPVLID